MLGASSFSKGSTLLALTWILAFYGGAVAHREVDGMRKCVHSTYMEPQLERLVKSIESIPIETHRSANSHDESLPTRRLLAEAKPGPLRIHVDYQLGSLPRAKVDFMKTDLIPAVKGVLERALNVRKRVQNRLYLPYTCISTFPGYPGYCHKVGFDCGTAKHNQDYFGSGKTCVQPFDDQCTKLPGGSGTPDADFILYVTAKHDAGCVGHAETVASAGFCSYDYDNWYGLPNRPLAGVANFCPDNIYIEEEKFGYMLDTAVHEVMHALVMSKQLFEKFIDSRGNPLKRVVSRTDGRLTIQTAKVVDVTREILGCPRMKGAALENEGGYGTADSHWERRLFLGELMVGSSSVSQRVVLSNLTLALAEDSGWYYAKYHTSGVLAAVEHRGCDFAEKDCRWPNKALDDTFCWDTDPAGEQTAICTPDHMAIGYCKNDLSLVGGCSVVQAFKNTHCTNPEHATETQKVDLGMRNKAGARCFPVKSYKISRTENYYTVFRSDLGAACFDTICKGNSLYLRIPATQQHPQKDIRCPTGAMINLEQEGLGYKEGSIGPCPNNKLVCESWGCPKDCNNHGMCFEGECFCDIGHVGEDCADFACPHHQCKTGYQCHRETGICRPKGKAMAPSKPSTKKEAAGGLAKVPEVTPAGPKTETWGGKSKGTRVLPEEFGETPKVLKKKPPSAKTPSPGGGSTGAVTSTKPKKRRRRRARPTRPESEAPDYQSPESFGVAAYGTAKTNSGRVVAVGYLKKCVIFEDTDGDLTLDSKTKWRLTEDTGEWYFKYFDRKDQLVVDPSYGNDCIDVFTNLRPVLRLRGFKTVRTLSGISTLAALAPKQSTDTSKTNFENENNSADAEKENTNDLHQADQNAEYTKYALEGKILKALGLKDKYILQRDFVAEAYSTEDKEAKRAVVYNAMISNTVIQISCFMDVSLHPTFRTSDFLFRVLGHFLQSGVDLDKLVYTDTVYLLVEEFVSEAQTNGRNSWILSEAIAHSNELAYDHLSRYSGLALLEATARLTVASQTKLCQMAADLQSGDLNWSEYSEKTSKFMLKKLTSSAKIPSISKVMQRSLSSTNSMGAEVNSAEGNSADENLQIVTTGVKNGGKTGSSVQEGYDDKVVEVMFSEKFDMTSDKEPWNSNQNNAQV